MKLRLVMILIIGPLFALASYFAMLHLQTERDVRDHARYTSNRVFEESLIADLVHELQVERDYSAGFLASKGDKFPQDLKAQRATTDLRLEPVRTQLINVQIEHAETLEKIYAQLDKLEEMRARIDRFESSVPGMIGYYTGVIQKLLSAAHPLESSGDSGNLQSLLEVRTSISAAKEQAGLERATGAGGLGGGFTLRSHNSFVKLGGAQDVLLSGAMNLLAEIGVEEPIFETDAFMTLSRTRNTIYSGFETRNYRDLTPEDWFATSADWIGQLRQVETNISTRIAELASQVVVEKDSRLRQFIAICFIGLGSVGAFALFVFEWMIWRIKKLTAVVDGFAKGRFDMFVPGIKRNDEISRMARAIYNFKQETLALRREAEDLKDNDEAELNAKHGRVVELVTEGLAALAQADLTCHFETPLDSQYDAIRSDFNTASSRLREVLSSIAVTVAELDQSSAAMKNSALDLAARSTEQVETIRDTADRMRRLSQDVETFGAEMQTASNLAGATRERANSSSIVVREAVEAMGRIQDSSEQIGQIISMIEDISFQTNLLALNAGVEAARAGDAGRGFAVVASEVRALAQRASNAAMEIKTLVEQSGKHVADGVDLVDRTGAELGEISGDIMQVDEVLNKILEASKGQISSLHELSESMNSINNLAAQNTSMAEQTRSTSGDIAQRSSQLAGLICDFRLNADATDRGAAA